MGENDGGGGAYLFATCRGHLTIDRASLSRPSTVPTRTRDPCNISWELITFFRYICFVLYQIVFACLASFLFGRLWLHRLFPRIAIVFSLVPSYQLIVYQMILGPKPVGKELMQALKRKTRVPLYLGMMHHAGQHASWDTFQKQFASNHAWGRTETEWWLWADRFRSGYFRRRVTRRLFVLSAAEKKIMAMRGCVRVCGGSSQ